MDELPAVIDDCVARALREDLGDACDRTSELVVPAGRAASARVVAKAAGVVAGGPVAAAVFEAVGAGAVDVGVVLPDGARLAPGDEVLRIHGEARAILAGERTALNFLQRLSGIATLTRRFADALEGSGAVVLETRKTTPGLRALEKYAVRVGGGTNHRAGLSNQVLLKENHFACARPLGYEEVVARAVAGAGPGRPVIAEARDVAEAVAAVRGGAGVVLLDNFAPGPALREAVAAVRDTAAGLGRTVAVEASGSIDLERVASVAACGVDRISVGALTHSAPALDLSLLVEVAE